MPKTRKHYKVKRTSTLQKTKRDGLHSNKVLQKIYWLSKNHFGDKGCGVGIKMINKKIYIIYI